MADVICTPAKCEYPEKVGLIPGVDVSIDGDVWPGSPYAKHIETCPWHNYTPITESNESREADHV